jgi:intracellular septation protein
MKLLFDFFPVLLFFVAFKLYGIFVATAVAMGATFAQIGWLWWRRRKIDKMLWVSLGVITVFGGATLLLENETFIKWKPTVLYWLFGTALLVASLAFKKNLVRSMMEHQVSWIVFFALMGALNLYVAYNYSTDAWVNFKLFGGIGLMFGFVLLQALLLARHVHDKNT